MQCVVTCTFELKRGRPESYHAVVAGLDRLGLRPVPQARGEESPSRIVLGAFTSRDSTFLRNCICFKLRDLFERQGLEWNAFVLVSGPDSAWATMASRPKAADPGSRWAIVLSEGRGAAPGDARKRVSGGSR
jgi:hypothetical protein